MKDSKKKVNQAGTERFEKGCGIKDTQHPWCDLNFQTTVFPVVNFLLLWNVIFVVVIICQDRNLWEMRSAS
jgi:hypothetical protein